MTRLLITLIETELIIQKEEGERLHSFGVELQALPFAGWSQRYAHALGPFGDTNQLLLLGQEMYAWLNGDRWLAPLLEQVAPPLIVDFQINRRRVTSAQRAFLEAPWELLADEGGPLALDARVLYAPVRRLGAAEEPAPPSDCRLNTVFMAASPRHGGSELDYEWEEGQILHLHEETALNMDLYVEETGNLKQLTETVQLVKPVDVVHLSCHGNIHGATGEPFLGLESQLGDQELVTAADLAAAYSTNRPALLFLSACKTSEQPAAPEQERDSLTADLIGQGFRAVLGWSGSVKDVAASAFAGELYRVLSISGTLEIAVAQARLQLKPDPGQEQPRSRPDWHLARLYLGPRGGGVLATAQRQRAIRDAQEGTKAFLDEKNQDVPVANRREFVGRRREIQQILRVFRERKHAGVLIHAIGHQGKSSLAARIANRLHEHRTVLIFGEAGQEYYYQPHQVLEKLKAANNEAVERIAQYQTEVGKGTKPFHTALKTLLEDHFSGIHGSPKVLLIVDDLEKILEVAKGAKHHQVKAAYHQSLIGIITAFAQAKTESRLLLTSRYAFALTNEHGESVADHLYALSLPSFKERQAHKQYHAKYVAEAAGKQHARPDLNRVVKACHGNPGLQDLVIRLHQEDTEAYEKALTSLEELAARQTAKDSPEKLTKFLADLTVEHLLGLLSSNDQHLIRLARNFSFPVPAAVWDALSEALGLKPDYAIHLLGLGVLERFEDLADPRQDAYWFNRLVGLRIRPEANIPQALCQIVSQTLRGHWTLEKIGSQSWVVHLEVTKWGLWAEDPAIGDYAARAVEGQFDAQQYQAAYALGSQVISFLENTAATVPPRLYRETAQAAVQLGNVDEALQWLIAAQRGFEQAKDRQAQAITTGYIARIKVSKGSVDEALALHELEMVIYEELGDKRSKAVTMGDIANILTVKEEVEKAMALHEEELAIYEELGDKHSKSVTLWEMAQMDLQRSDLEAAFPRMMASYQLFAELGNASGLAIVGGTLGRVLWYNGAQEEGRTVLERAMAAYAKLGRQADVAEIQKLLESGE